MTQETLVIVSYALLHFIMNYGFIFWGNSLYSINTFRLQRKAIRIIVNTRNTDSHRDLFIAVNILHLQSQYILLLLYFVVMDMDQYKFNLDIHGKDTRHGTTRLSLVGFS